MNSQRPPHPSSGNGQDRPDAAATPDSQPTQPVPVSHAKLPTETPGDAERLSLLRSLSATELAILRHRCAGATTSQIAAQLGLSHDDARAHVGNVLDKLGVTHGRAGTSLSRLAAFCPLLSQVDATAGSGAQLAVPPTGRPSRRAAELTDADDAALLSQHGGAPPPGDDGRQRWIIGGVLAFVLIAALVALLMFIDDENGDDVNDADITPTTEEATATAVAVIPATATTEAPTATPEPEPTATDVPATETPEPVDEEGTAVAATETAAAQPEPTATDVPPTETPTPVAPTATATVATPEPTPTVPAPTPPPAAGTLAYEADWSTGDDGWDLTDGWAIQGGNLVTTSAAAEPLLSPFDVQQADYAVEIEMVITNLNNCDERAGVFARITEGSTPAGAVLVGYAGSVCDDEWHIESVLEDDRESLADGARPLATGSHVYRLEVAGQRIRLFIDNTFVGEATDDRWDETGGAGIYIDGDLNISVTAFRVYTLTGQP